MSPHDASGEKANVRLEPGWLAVAVLGLVLVAIFVKLQPLQGPDGLYLGHDYYHYLTRLYIGALHFWQNGFAVPHYTPSLCGGIPFFADPQSVYYSLPQWLAFVINPVEATHLTIILFYVAAYLGFLKLARSVFGFHPVASHLGALLFVLNGFSFSHLVVGHITHHSYLLFPWVLYFPFKSTRAGGNLLRDVSLFSLLLIYTFYSGGMHTLVVFAVGFLVALPLLLERVTAEKSGRRFLLFLASSILCFGLACSGKLIASALLSTQFFKTGIDSSGESVFELITRYFWFDPATTPALIRFGHIHFGPWEYVGFLSKLTFVALMLFPFFLFRKDGGRRLGSCVVYGLLVILIGLIAAGTPFNSSLPFFRSYHNPIKILSAFIPFLCLISSYGIDFVLERCPYRVPSGRTGRLLYLIVAVCLIAEFGGYANYFLAIKPAFSYRYSPETYRNLAKERKLTPVTRVVNAYGTDDIGLTEGCTSVACYEPMFGYRAQGLNTQLQPGETVTIRDGHFNLTHPGCLIYPAFFHCTPWDRIRSDDKANFDHFIRGESPTWGVPGWQSALLGLNFSFVVFLLLSVAWGCRGIFQMGFASLRGAKRRSNPRSIDGAFGFEKVW